MDNRSLKCVRFAFVLIAALMFMGTHSHAADRNTRLIDSLNIEARKSYNVSFANARLLASVAKGLSLEYGYTKGRIASTCLLSLVLTSTNEANAACDSLHDLLRMLGDDDRWAQQSLYITLGTCWYFRGDFDSARKYSERGLKLFPAHDTSIEYANACLLIARVFNKKGMTTQALNYYTQALGVLKIRQDRSMQGWSNHVIGMIYHRQRLYNKAIVSFGRAIADFESEGNKCGIASSLMQLGNTYFMLTRDDSATACYERSLNTARAMGDSLSMAFDYSNLSRVLLEHRRCKEAVEYAEKALALLKSGNYISIEAGSYQQLGDIYAELKQLPTAIKYVQMALLLARASDNKTLIGDCYKSLSEFYTEMKQYKPALDNLLAAYRIKDSIQSVAFSSQLAEMDVKYETEKKEAEIRLLYQQEQINNLKMEEQQNNLNRKNLLLLSLAALIAAIVVAIYFYVSRRRQAEHFRQLEAIRIAEEAERQRIAKDIHDELGSGLSRITVLSDQLNRQFDDKGRAVTTIHSISDTSRHLIDNMRDMVWNMNPENTTLDNLFARIREYSVDYLEDLAIDVTLDMPEDVPSRKIPMEVSRNVHMILKESLQNIVKHAQATSVRIVLSLTPRFRMEIHDNGKGYELGLRKGGNGIKNISARSGAIGAKVDIISSPGKGSSIILELDLDAEPAVV